MNGSSYCGCPSGSNPNAGCGSNSNGGCGSNSNAGCSQNSDTRSLLCRCSGKVLCFIAALFALALGLILGVIFALPLVLAIPALIVLAVVLGILTISLLILRCCMGCNNGFCG